MGKGIGWKCAELLDQSSRKGKVAQANIIWGEIFLLAWYRCLRKCRKGGTHKGLFPWRAGSEISKGPFGGTVEGVLVWVVEGVQLPSQVPLRGRGKMC